MTERVVLTKAAILQGKARKETVYIEELSGDLILCPLTDGEWTEVQAMLNKNLNVVGTPTEAVSSGKPLGGKAADRIKIRAETRINMGEFTQTQAEANYLAVSFSLSRAGDAWSVEDVKQMPAGVVEKIATHVFRISGVNPEEVAVAQSFRKER